MWDNCKCQCKGEVAGCYKSNVKYSPPNDVHGPRRSVETSIEACKARCESRLDCNFFSFWEKNLPEDNGCTLFGSAAEFGKENKTFDFITGPSTCPGEIQTSCQPKMQDYPAKSSCSYFQEETEEQPKGCQGGSNCCSLELPCAVGEGGHLTI